MVKELKKILVISLQGIGDLLLTTPLLCGLKSNFPQAKLSVLTLQSNKDVLFNNSDVDEIIAFDARQKKNALKILMLIFKLRRKKFDLSICTYPSGLHSAFIGYLSGVKQRFGQGISLFKNYRRLFTKQTPIKEIKHAVLMNLDFLKLLDLDIARLNTNLVLNLREEDKKFASEFLRSNNVADTDLLIAIHAGGGKNRSWPEERFAKVADILIEEFQAKILFIGGGKEISLVNEIIQLMKNKPLNATGKISLLGTTALLEKSQLLICNNSGPMHIATALRIPTVSISGPVDSRIHGPWGQNHIVLQKELECNPCYYPFLRNTLEETKLKNRWFKKTFRCKTDDFRCLTSITVEDVLKAVETILKGHSNK